MGLKNSPHYKYLPTTIICSDLVRSQTINKINNNTLVLSGQRLALSVTGHYRTANGRLSVIMTLRALHRKMEIWKIDSLFKVAPKNMTESL